MIFCQKQYEQHCSSETCNIPRCFHLHQKNGQYPRFLKGSTRRLQLMVWSGGYIQKATSIAPETGATTMKSFQDLRLRNLIGAGERGDGLYYFQGIPELHAVCTSDLLDFELWHRRMGRSSVRSCCEIVASNN
ncbi:unnamed protein product [Cuscuta europaea]|uniref:Uncharacterized protein n=1 Tax=Cuscuta europaea TaxID=41803 RepID=A0A9P0Z9H1_CUSEU|nr:unnamed protein product [Cuscuta europaea]